jgi:hypothetical protein
MIYNTFQLNFKDLNLNVNQIEKVLGCQAGESQETIAEIISEVVKEAEKKCRIKAEYRIFSNVTFNNSEKIIIIGNQSFNLKKIVYNQLKKSHSVAVFLCTAGGEIGLMSRKEMKDGDLLKGYIFDLVGSEIVDAAADLIQNELESRIINEGKKTTNRFSPGYCGWDVAEQHKLFSLMPYNYCGIHLNSSALMDPIKSISGFIGIGENVKKIPYTCSLCDMKNCIYRKIGEDNKKKDFTTE